MYEENVLLHFYKLSLFKIILNISFTYQVTSKPIYIISNKKSITINAAQITLKKKKINAKLDKITCIDITILFIKQTNNQNIREINGKKKKKLN